MLVEKSARDHARLKMAHSPTDLNRDRMVKLVATRRCRKLRAHFQPATALYHPTPQSGRVQAFPYPQLSLTTNRTG